MTVYQILAIVFFGLAFVALVVTIILFFNLEIVRVIGDLSGITAKKQIEQIRTQTTNISYGAHKRVQSNNNVAIDNMFTNSTTSDSQAKAQAHESKRLKNRRSNVATAAAQIADPPKFTASPGSGTVSLDTINSTDELKTGRTDRLKKRNQKHNLSEAATDVLNSDISESETDVLSDMTETPTDVLDDNVPTDILIDTEYDIDATEMPTGVLNSDSETARANENEYREAATGVLSDDIEEGGTSVISDDTGGTTVLSNETEEVDISFNIISDETVINTDEEID